MSSYFILKRLFSQATALLFLIFWSINPLIAHYDSVAWNPTLIPIAVLTTWILLKKIYDNNRIITWLLLGSAIGFFIHMHVQFAFIAVFVCIALWIMRKQTQPDIIRILFFTIPIFLSFVPLVIFDLRHDFLNLNALQSFFSPHSFNAQSNISSWVPVFQNVIQPITVAKSLFIASLFYCVFFVIQCFLYINKKGFIKTFYGSSILLWILFPIVFAKYGQRPSEYYFLFLYPFIYVVLADFFFSIKKIPLFIIIALILLIANLGLLQFNLKTDYYSLKYKDELVRRLAEKMKGKVFNLSYTTTLTTDYGFRYLIEHYGIKPTGNWKDPLVQIQIPFDSKSSIRVANMGVIIPKELAD